LLQAAIQSCVLTIGSTTGIYNSSNRLAVTRLTRVLSASGQKALEAVRRSADEIRSRLGVVETQG
jgi:hypothetical protein